jgi:hypothetical protein
VDALSAEEAFSALVDVLKQALGVNLSDLDPFSYTEVTHWEDRAWTWLSCNELGWFGTSAGFQSPWVNLSYWNEVCLSLFNESFGNFSNVAKRYGGVTPGSSNVVFSQGSFDPWSTVGVSTAHESNAQWLWVIDGASHCSDLHWAKPGEDSDALVKARGEIIDKVVSWLSRNCENLCKNGECLHDQCLCDIGYSGTYCGEKVVPSLEFWLVGMTALMLPLIILLTVGGSAWWVMHMVHQQRFVTGLATS